MEGEGRVRGLKATREEASKVMSRGTHLAAVYPALFLDDPATGKVKTLFNLYSRYCRYMRLKMSDIISRDKLWSITNDPH